MRLVTTPSTLSGSASTSSWPVARRGDELLHEERIAAGSLDDGRELLGGEIVARRPTRRAAARPLRGSDRDGATAPAPAACPSAATNPPPSGGASSRRATASSATRVPRWRSRSEDASSIQCASSKRSSVGGSSSAVSRASTTPFRRARRNDGCSSSVSGVESTDTSSTSASERHPRDELRRRSARCSRQSFARSPRRRRRRSTSSSAAQQLPEHEVRRRRLVLLARSRHDGEPFGAVAQLFDDARLADPGVADQLDEAAEAHAHGYERRVEDGQLALAVDEREPLPRPGERAPRSGADGDRLDRLRLALERQRLRPASLRTRSSSARRDRASSRSRFASAFAISRAASAAVPPRMVYARR